VIKTKKSLGQNFLIDQNIIEKILDLVEIKDRSILEIGPGTGNLTSKILEKNPKKLIVIEKDNRLIDLLKDNFGSKIKIINHDVLKVNENLLMDEKLTVFGNLPYNISTEILCKWILNINDQNIWFDYLILMFQKEVADRIIALSNSKNYGRLSILSNWKLDIEKICDIKPSSFSPKPKIDSSILFFKPKKDFIKLANPKNLEKISRIFFMHRRKMIKKPYNQLFNGNEEISNKLGIKLSLRPQNINLETDLKLTKEYEKLRD
jgi:16S rRNA (adenine1518-N6/adenine1519-N6)-dimethyltransferase